MSEAVKDNNTALPLVSLRGIWKVFEGVAVLKGIDFDLNPGEIHALLGGNGSGKSTTVKILSGAYQPTVGKIELGGHPVSFDNPAAAHRGGVYMVPQEPHIFPHLTIEENLLLGEGVQFSGALAKARKLAAEMGFEGDFSEPGGNLSIANQQLVEILRGLLRDAKVLIFDEPTSALTSREADNLFEHMRKLANRGIGILFISHRLNEVIEISEKVSVLRDGVFVLSAPTKSVDAHQLVKSMLPKAFEEKNVTARLARVPEKPGDAGAVLEARNLSAEMFHDVSFRILTGEIVGLAGLVGAGRTELAEAILGIGGIDSGEVLINGAVAENRTPRRCQEMGLTYVPEDRHSHGIFLELPNIYTMTASILRELGRLLLSSRRERDLAKRFADRLDIKTSGPLQIARTLSGGNQQKIVLAKALATEPDAIVLDEPTRGIDAGARQDVYRIIRGLAQQGVAVLLISSEFGEIVDLSDRVLIMYHGRMTELTASAIGMETVSAAAFGLSAGAAA